MKALILYVVFVMIGALIATGIGYYVEIEFSSAASLIVFLASIVFRQLRRFMDCGHFCDGWHA
jgi:hypothetical protein